MKGPVSFFFFLDIEGTGFSLLIQTYAAHAYSGTKNKLRCRPLLLHSRGHGPHGHQEAMAILVIVLRVTTGAGADHVRSSRPTKQQLHSF